MAFNSFTYFLFIFLVYLLFYFTTNRLRWVVLLLSSYLFYSSFNAPYLLFTLLFISCIGYLFGLRIAGHHDERLRRLWFWAGCSLCVASLALVKYLPFLGSQSPWATNVISIGVSYFTFQAISYMADIYLEKEEPEPHFGRFALYMSFFPKLLQGPIERAGNLLPQLRSPYQFDYNLMRSGLLLFACGAFKKFVVADRFALYADQVYNHVHDYTGLSLVVGTYSYALQIYFDFSGYTDMARGTARIFGIDLTENFNRPYLARSIADFWRRWHITFSRWILDYIFTPLQMGWRDSGRFGTAAALLVAFLVSGVWHGATWGFVVWGLLHGIYLASSIFYRPYQKRLHQGLGIKKGMWLECWQVTITFNLVCFAWIFFRANNLHDAVYVVGNIFRVYKGLRLDIFTSNGGKNLVVLILSTLLMSALAYSKKELSMEAFITSSKIGTRWLCYYYLIIMIMVFDAGNKSFVYFKF